MESSINLRALGSALNGPDMSVIRDTCLRERLVRLQTANRKLTDNTSVCPKALTDYRTALQMVTPTNEERLCWKDLRTLNRILEHARKLDACLSA